MRNFPSWYYFVVETYQYRFEELLKTVDSIAFKKMDERLLNHLRVLSEAANSYTIEATHRTIANELGTSREVISRLLKSWNKEGISSFPETTLRSLICSTRPPLRQLCSQPKAYFR